jgi:hypothetical protein
VNGHDLNKRSAEINVHLIKSKKEKWAVQCVPRRWQLGSAGHSPMLLDTVNITNMTWLRFEKFAVSVKVIRV